jgi:hypothetical protein
MRTPLFHAPRATDPFVAVLRKLVETGTRFSLTPVTLFCLRGNAGSIHRNDRPLRTRRHHE